MNTIGTATFPRARAIGLLLEAALATSLSAAELTVPTGGLTATRSGDELILSFPTTSTDVYTVQTFPNLLQQWTNFQSGIQGDGTVKMVTISNAVPVGKGFYRLLIQRPASLLLSQSLAFTILGRWCGGIR